MAGTGNGRSSADSAQKKRSSAWSEVQHVPPTLMDSRRTRTPLRARTPRVVHLQTVEGFTGLPPPQRGQPLGGLGTRTEFLSQRIDGHCNTPRDRDRLIAILVRSSLPKRALPMQIAQNVDQRQTRSRLAVPRQSRSFHAGKVKPVTTTAAAPIRLRAVRLDRPRRGDSTGRHGGVAFAAECVAVQFAVTVPIVADSRVHGSHEGDPDREVYSPMQPYDCASLSPDQRAQQIAALLATGLRRLLVRSALPACPKNLPDLSPNGLELPREIRLSGHAG
jgi:hypothetical protein